MRKIGILGGSFDPVHETHIKMAKAAKEAFSLSEVLLMPAKYPPHKLNRELAKDEDRLAMLRLTCEGLSGIFPSDFELKLNKVSYTADTLSYLKKEYLEDELFFIVGGDSILYMEKWYRPDIIFQKASILYVARKGSEKKRVEEHIKNVLLPQFYEAKIFEIPFQLSDISSSRIREELKKGNLEAVRKDLNPFVFQYIIENRLYN